MVATMGVYDGAWRSNPYVLWCSGGGKRLQCSHCPIFFQNLNSWLVAFIMKECGKKYPQRSLDMSQPHCWIGRVIPPSSLHQCGILRGGEQVLQWLFGMGGDDHVFPLMDFVTSDSQVRVCYWRWAVVLCTVNALSSRVNGSRSEDSLGAPRITTFCHLESTHLNNFWQFRASWES